MGLSSTRIGPGSHIGGNAAGWSPLSLNPEFFIDAQLSGRAGGKVKNLGTGGSALDATLGSAAASAWFNGEAMVLPGVNGNSASTPDAAALDITGDLEIVVRCNPDSLTPASVGQFVGKGASAYRCFLGVTGTVSLRLTRATVSTSHTSTVTLGSVGFTDGQTFWLKFTREALSGDIKFYYAADQTTEPTVWTQLGATVAASTTATDVSADALYVGALSVSSEHFAGKVYRAIVRNGIGGTTVFDANFARADGTTTFTESSSNAATVTLNRSTTGTDTNDPVDLVHAGTNYLYLPGVAGNYASAPDLGAYDILGDVEVAVRVALDDWTPAATTAIASRSTTTDPDRGWLFTAKTGGNLSLDWFPTGSAASNLFANSTVALPATDGTAYWVRFTLDVDNGAGGYDLKFWYAADSATEPTVWTQLGTTITGGAPTSLSNIVSGVNVGSYGAASFPAQGKFYRCIVRSGLSGGTTVFDADFTRGITSGAQASFTEFSSNAATVTINRATSGRKAVAVVRNVLLLGTDDYLEVADNALLDMGASDSFSAVVILRQWGTLASNARLIQKGAAASPRWLLFNNLTNNQAIFQINDTVTSAQSLPPTAAAVGNLVAYSGVVDRTGQTVNSYANNTAGTTQSTAAIGSAVNADAMRISGIPASGSFFEGELVAAAVFRRALTAAEIASIVAYYGAA